jgi:hypothetical protein
MEQTKGNFTTRIVRDKRPGDNKPVYEGRLTVPGTGEEYGFSLFLGTDKKGQKYFSGPITKQPVNGKLDDQLSALLESEPAPDDVSETQDRPFRIFLLPTQSKDRKEGRGEPPAFWGRANLGDVCPELQVSAWEQDSRYQINAHITKYLRGSTQLPMEKSAEAGPKPLDPDMRSMVLRDLLTAARAFVIANRRGLDMHHQLELPLT